MPTFRDLLNEHAVASWDKQESLFRVMGGEHDWKLDLDRGLLTLTNEAGAHDFQVQWLGTADKESSLWVWSWASEETDTPEALKDAARALQSYGEEYGIEEFTQPERELTKSGGDVLALAASGLCRADGYYLCEMDHGLEYFLFHNAEVRGKGDSSPVRCMNVFLSILPHVDIDHRPALVAFLKSKGYECVEEGPKLTATGEAGAVFAGFDALGRISEIRTQVKNQTPAAPPTDEVKA